MDYLVITHHDQYIDKDEIQLYVETTSDQRDATEDLLWRASNQSLLADLIAALTGDDRLIRQGLMITAVADSCKFELNVAAGVGSNRGVAVMSDLVCGLKPEREYIRKKISIINIILLVVIVFHNFSKHSIMHIIYKWTFLAVPFDEGVPVQKKTLKFV